MHIPRASVSVVGGIQPGILTRLLTRDRLDNGLAARLLLARPPRRRRQYTGSQVSASVKRDYAQLLERLYRLEFADDGALPSPVDLGLTPEARSRWLDFCDEWAGEEETLTEDLAAAWSKLEGAAARFALVHHVVRHQAPDTEVGMESIQAGIAMARWFGGEARRIYAEFGTTSSRDCLEQLADRIVRRGGVISIRDLQRSNNRQYRTADDARADLQRLVDAGVGVWEDGGLRFRCVNR